MRQESYRSSLSRVDWWGVTSLLIVGLSVILSGWILAAVVHFVWRHWL